MKTKFANGAFQLRGAKAEKRRRERQKSEQDARDRGEEPLSAGQAKRLQALLPSLKQPTKPELSSTRVAQQTSSGDATERQVVEAARALGVRASTLNEDQRRLLVHMSKLAMTDAKRRQWLQEME